MDAEWKGALCQICLHGYTAKSWENRHSIPDWHAPVVRVVTNAAARGRSADKIAALGPRQGRR